jgi:hypothetical protein
LLFPSIGWCGPFLVCYPSEGTTSYIIRCDQEFIGEVAAESDGSLFYDIAGQNCSEWSVNAANSESVIDACDADDTECDGDIDGIDLQQLVETGLDVVYFANHFGTVSQSE